MATALPLRPAGDVATTWALIGELEGYRQGLVALQRDVEHCLDETGSLSGIYMLEIDTLRMSGTVDVAAALAGLDATITSLRTAVRKLEGDLRVWERTCAQIRASQ